MRVDKNKFNEMLARWIKWDGELWAELRDIQIKLLHQRIVKEMSFFDMADHHNCSIQQIRQIFAAILFKIERSHGKQIASLLRHINTELEAIETGVRSKDDITQPFGKVFLN